VDVLEDRRDAPAEQPPADPDGTALAKDVWLLGIGLTLLATGRGGGAPAGHSGASTRYIKIALLLTTAHV